MTLHFRVLASGSAGNASWLEADGFGLLLDVGLGPRQLQERLRLAGLAWERVRAVLLTHTHTDHWHEATLGVLRQRNITLYCHPDHDRKLLAISSTFAELRGAGLVRHYEPDNWMGLSGRFSYLPFRVSHDSGVTCGFRFEGPTDFFGEPTRLAYVADLGTWDHEVAEFLADVDILALEFNHDVTLQRNSGRSPRLIARVLGDRGHLSNDQAAALILEVLRRSSPGRLGDVVQLHLSQDCNRPDLAQAVLQDRLRSTNPQVRIHTAAQHEIGPPLVVGAGARVVRPRSRRATRTTRLRPPAEYQQGWLPGWEE